MRTLTLFVLLLGAKLIAGAKEPKSYSKFTYLNFTTSGVTCKNPRSKLRVVSRYESFIDMECDLQRPLNKILFNFAVWHKTGVERNYRLTMNATVEVCETIRNIDKLPVFSGLIEWLNSTFPGISHQCPYEFFKIVNGSVSNSETKTTTMKYWKNAFKALLPNGIYKNIFLIYDDVDSFIGRISMRYETYIFSNFETF